MSKDYRRCYTCLNSCTDDLVSLQATDQDEVSYLKKLKTCINDDLLEWDPMEICLGCIDQLRISYQFKINVLNSQAILKLQIQEQVPHTNVVPMNQEYAVKEEVCSEVKQEKDIACQQDIIELDSARNSDSNMTTTSTTSPTNRRSGDEFDSFFNFDDLLIEPSSCDICDMKFNSKLQLRKHKASVHIGEFSYVCPHCSQRFKLAYNFKAHLESHTAGERNDMGKYCCRVCDKTFKNSSMRRYHEKAHEKPPGQKCQRTPYLCPICGKTFSFMNGKQRHMNVHMGIRNFKCTVCNKGFARRHHLMEHMRSHTGEKPFVCESCGQTFSMKGSMDAHRRNKHGDKLSSSGLPKKSKKQKNVW